MPEQSPQQPPALEYAPRPRLAWFRRRRNGLILLALCITLGMFAGGIGNR